MGLFRASNSYITSLFRVAERMVIPSDRPPAFYVVTHSNSLKEHICQPVFYHV